MKCKYCGYEKIYAKGYCKNCYERNRRKGTPEYKFTDEYIAQREEYRKEYNRKYQKEHYNKEYHNNYNKEYWEQNKDILKVKKAEWYQKNKERIQKQQKEYRERRKNNEKNI